MEKSDGKITEALASSQENLAIVEKLLSNDPKSSLYQIDYHQGLTIEIDLELLAGRKEEAHRLTQRALEFLNPLVHSTEASQFSLFDYAWILTHTPFPDQQNPEAAVESARRAVALSHESDPEMLQVLALAFAKAGKRAQAIETFEKALSLLPSPKSGAPVPELRKLLDRDLASLRQ